MSRLYGTAPPICTVTVIVCGASTALGRTPLRCPSKFPRAAPEVFNANCSGVQTPGRDDAGALCAHRGRHPGNRRSQLQIQRTIGIVIRFDSLRLSGLPFAPCAMETGPTVDDTRRNRGAAFRPAAKKKAAVKTAAPFWTRPTREPPSYTPRCSRPPESTGIPPLRSRRTSATDGI